MHQSKKTINNAIGALSGLLNLAKEWGVIAYVPKIDCSNVVNASPAERQNRIADELTAIRTIWLRAGDEKALRLALLDLLRHLEQNE